MTKATNRGTATHPKACLAKTRGTSIVEQGIGWRPRVRRWLCSRSVGVVRMRQTSVATTQTRARETVQTRDPSTVAVDNFVGIVVSNALNPRHRSYHLVLLYD
jgi:hypothetical protein